MDNRDFALGLGLAFVLGYGMPVIVLIAACVLRRVRSIYEHRWPAIALFAIPVLAAWMFDFSWYWFTWGPEARDTDWHRYAGAAFALALLVAAYPRVRRFAHTGSPGHSFLRLYWQFTIVGAFISLCLIPIWQNIGEESLRLWAYRISLTHPDTSVTVSGSLFGFHYPWWLSAFVLVWFIYKAARISPQHAWLLLALSLAASYLSLLGKRFIPESDPAAASVYAALALYIALPFILNGMMLWVFARYQEAPSVRVVAVVIPMALLLSASERWAFDAMFTWPVVTNVIGGVAFWPAHAFVRLAGDFIGLLPTLALAWLAILWAARRRARESKEA